MRLPNYIYIFIFIYLYVYIYLVKINGVWTNVSKYILKVQKDTWLRGILTFL